MFRVSLQNVMQPADLTSEHGTMPITIRDSLIQLVRKNLTLGNACLEIDIFVNKRYVARILLLL